MHWIFSPTARPLFGYFGVTWHVTVFGFFLPSLLCQKRIFLSNKTVSAKSPWEGNITKFFDVIRLAVMLTARENLRSWFAHVKFFPSILNCYFRKTKVKINCVQNVQRARVILKRTARFFSFSFFLFELNFPLSKCYHGSSGRTSLMGRWWKSTGRGLSRYAEETS